MTRERMSRPNSSVPNQCPCEEGARRAGRLIAAGSCGAIQGANNAKITNRTTSAAPAAASGLCRAFWLRPCHMREDGAGEGGEMAGADMGDRDAILYGQIDSANSEPEDPRRAAGWATRVTAAIMIGRFKEKSCAMSSVL